VAALQSGIQSVHRHRSRTIRIQGCSR
jgi:hypothetical protein